MEKMNRGEFGGPMTLVWPWWKANEAGREKHTDATNTLPRKNIPVLPLEIIDRILREACEWPLMRAERQVLTASTLVCKSWLPPAQRLLYHSLIVETGSGFSDDRLNPGTIGSEELLQRSHLLGFTRSLSIRVLGGFTATVLLSDGPEGSQECLRERVQIPNFFFLLAHTPRLRLLELAMVERDIVQCKPHLLDWLSSLVLPFEVLNLNDGGYFSTTFIYDLVRIWPTIRALRVVTRYNGPLPERPNTSLRELRLPVTSLVTVIKWFLPPPPPDEQSNLWFLELYTIPKEALPALSIHGPSVFTLTLTNQPAFEFAHLFTKLEELVISGPLWRGPLPALPKTLKHIRLQFRVAGIMSNSVLAAIAQVVPELPDLRVLSIEEALTTHVHYRLLREACETRRVEILVNSVDSSGRMVHPYHAEMDRFPRQFTFSEFFDPPDGHAPTSRLT